MTPELGIIEGFFGRPWSWPERRAVVHALRPHGYGFYLYAPKADAHLRRRWQDPHPESDQAEIAAFSSFCRQRGVRFGIGLTPFDLQLAPAADWPALIRARLDQLAPLGLDDLAILFDDMRGDLPDLAERQAAIVNIAAGQGIAARILCCPSYYSDDPVLDRAFGRRPVNYLEDLGRLLEPGIEIMWTGEEVCARELSPGHLTRVAEQIGRKPFLWDNYPVNDGPRMSQHLHLRGFTGRPAGIAAHIAAHGINPALQPQLTLPPALTLATSYRDGDAYSYAAALDEASCALFGRDLADRLRADLLTFQDRGRDRIGADRNAELQTIYARFDHPAAREVIAWLAGDYDVSDEQVHTQ